MSARPGYNDYMRSLAWAAKRARRLEIDGHKCRTCGATADEYPLQVHHVTYENLGHEDAEHDLITLCSLCHQAVTDTIRRRRYASRYTSTEFETITAQPVARIEVSTYGMADLEVSVDIIERHAVSQRPNGKSAEPLGKVDETDFLQARQDRRGL